MWHFIADFGNLAGNIIAQYHPPITNRRPLNVHEAGTQTVENNKQENRQEPRAAPIGEKRVMAPAAQQVQPPKKKEKTVAKKLNARRNTVAEIRQTGQTMMTRNTLTYTKHEVEFPVGANGMPRFHTYNELNRMAQGIKIRAECIGDSAALSGLDDAQLFQKGEEYFNAYVDFTPTNEKDDVRVMKLYSTHMKECYNYGEQLQVGHTVDTMDRRFDQRLSAFKKNARNEAKLKAAIEENGDTFHTTFMKFNYSQCQQLKVRNCWSLTLVSKIIFTTLNFIPFSLLLFRMAAGQ